MNLAIRRITTQVLLSLIFLSHLQAQEQPVRKTISGLIKDSLTKEPLAFATIAVLTKAGTPDTVLSCNEQGLFTVTLPPNGRLTFTATGYHPKTMTANALTFLPEPVIYLKAQLQELKGVTVTSTKPLIRREVDKLIYNMEADPESKFRSTLDILKKVPFLSVTAQGGLLFKGNSSYRILINGKPSGMMDNNPSEVLKSLPASTIQDIEVYTTPPSKYDAEGLAGVINIITTKKVGEGYKGTLNLNESIPTGGPGAGFSFTATHKKFGVELYGGANSTHNPAAQTSISRTTTGDQPTQLAVSGSGKNNNNGRYLGSQFSYEIDSLQLVTAQLNANGFYSKGQVSRFSMLQDAATLLQQFRQQNTVRGKNNGFDGSLNYQLGFKKDKSKLLTASYRFMQYQTGSRSENGFTELVHYDIADFNQFNNTAIQEQTGQADYIQTVKKIKLEAGIKAIFRQNQSNFHTLQYDGSTFIEDPAQQNVFTNNQTVLSAYNTYMLALKQWSFKAGARLEQTTNHIDFQSTRTQVQNHYLNLIPAVVINRNNTNGSYINLGYSQRLKRPGINRLNPFVNRSNPDFEETGNPHLKATLLHNFDLGYGFNRKQSLNIGLNYAFAHNFDLRSSRYDPATRITYITYSNSGDIAALVLHMNLNLTVTKALKTVINGNLAHFWIETDADGPLQKLTRFLYSASMNHTYTFSKDWTVTASADFIGKNIAPAQVQGTVNGFIATSFGVSRNLWSNKLALSAYVNNPFTRYRNNRTEISGFNFVQTDITEEYFRKACISINYKFGKLKQDIKRNKRGINNNDVAN
ncbi:outer membrane beta-barrel family protein [Niabella drilacis]|uniref:Outer membrane receptor proteins, mostly Fe transport n=1 Tax=Niabella drilacis (strain DSM 25811 / CCM 8410 / CCUG 62505 / LMG 26954 / E90) TaxID=1285928 RepID=A0A1G6XX53_NIADE|nr:outer membrane beta-barrel family protein [Niabella drilacis]SDD82690.1 Outer membrane receptor proteins, mostly Fe transport [Niabella drilacis]